MKDARVPPKRCRVGWILTRRKLDIYNSPAICRTSRAPAQRKINIQMAVINGMLYYRVPLTIPLEDKIRTVLSFLCNSRPAFVQKLIPTCRNLTGIFSWIFYESMEMDSSYLYRVLMLEENRGRKWSREICEDFVVMSRASQNMRWFNYIMWWPFIKEILECPFK